MADEPVVDETKQEVAAVDEKTADAPKDGKDTKKERPKRERDNKPVEFVAQPDQTEYNITVNKLEKGVETITKKIDNLNQQIKEQGDVRQEHRNAKKEVIEKLRTIKKSKEALYAERNVFQEKVVSIETERKNRREKTTNLRASLKFLKVEEIDKAVAAIEYRLSTSQLTLKREKELIQEIKELKAQKDVVKLYEEAKAHEDAEVFDTKELREKRDAKNKEIRVIRDAEQEHQAKMLELRNKENAVNDNIKSLVVERRNCNTEVRELKKQLVKTKIDFEKQSRAHKRYVDYTAWVKRQEARQRRQERIEAEKKWREEQAAREAGEVVDGDEENAEPKVKAHPYEKEMYLCQELSRYLRRVAPQDDEDGKKEETQEEKQERLADERNAAFKGKQGTVLQKKGKALESDFFPGAGAKKGKKGKNKKRKGLTTLTHIPDVFAQFASLSIEIPMDVGAVPKALKALDEKLEYFKTAPPPLDSKEKKKLADKQKQEATAQGDKETEAQEAEEREEAKQRAKAMVEAEQKRIADEAAQADAAADAEAAKAREEVDKATEVERQEQIEEFGEKKRRKSIVQEVADAAAAAAAAAAPADAEEL